MNFVDRPVDVHYTEYDARPIVGGLMHDTESLLPLTVDQSLGSWHWLIGRDGVIYRDVSEEHAAWHVQATGHSAASLALTRWRPSWLVECPDGGVSDTNYCTVGIELVSHQAYRDAGEPYTDAQYASLKELVADIESRYGPLPWVGHGELQTDRSDPVLLNWATAGFGPRQSDGRYFVAAGPPVPPEVPVSILTDEELDRVAAAYWGSKQGYNPALAICRSWREEWKAGRFKGKPAAGEVPLPGRASGDDAVYRVFGNGICTYRGGVASWDG